MPIHSFHIPAIGNPQAQSLRSSLYNPRLYPPQQLLYKFGLPKKERFTGFSHAAISSHIDLAAKINLNVEFPIFFVFGTLFYSFLNFGLKCVL
jgi:hypothetical protein